MSAMANASSAVSSERNCEISPELQKELSAFQEILDQAERSGGELELSEMAFQLSSRQARILLTQNYVHEVGNGYCLTPKGAFRVLDLSVQHPSLLIVNREAQNQAFSAGVQSERDYQFRQSLVAEF